MGKPKPTPLEFCWDGRIRSPRELFRLLHDFLNKYEYEHIYHELKDQPGAIEGTATFWDSLIGRKDYKKRNIWLLLNGLILMLAGVIVLFKGFFTGNITAAVIGFIILMTGSILTSVSRTKLRKCISLRVEGETYRARAEKRGKTSSEVYDVVSNCRVVFNGKVGIPEVRKTGTPQSGKAATLEPSDFEVAKLSKKPADWYSLKSEFDTLTADFQSLRPKIEIPEAIADDKE